VLDRVTWFRQASVRWRDEERTVYFDPWGTGDDPEPADLILITHAHFDHFQPGEIEKLRRAGTEVVAPHDVASELGGNVTPVRPGETHELAGVHLATVPAYNSREEALGFHPRENDWVGYIVELGGTSYYHAGDTDDLPELREIRADVAFLPIGGRFTMDWRAAAGLAKAIAPSVAVPIHYGFVICSPSDGVRFRDAAAPVPVELLAPVDDFEQD
jgi:L-ascorbate metabolism protein UlaG (beta-lactamase superfamily)